MSSVDLAIEEVRKLSEDQAAKLLSHLRHLDKPTATNPAMRSADAARGFARRYRPEPRATVDWMKELREGET